MSAAVNRLATKSPSWLDLVSAAARAPAFLIPVLIAATFGAGRATDAYFVAYSAVLFLGGTLAQGIEQAIAPFAARVIHEEAAPRRYLDRAAVRCAGAGAFVWIIGVPIFTGLATASLRSSILGYAALFTPLTLCWCAAAAFTGTLIAQWKIGWATGAMLWRGMGAVLGIAAIPDRKSVV